MQQMEIKRHTGFFSSLETLLVPQATRALYFLPLSLPLEEKGTEGDIKAANDPW